MTATYTAPVTGAVRVSKVLGGFPGVSVFFGSVDISTYSTTHLEVTGITSLFKNKNCVVFAIPTELYVNEVGWDATNHSFVLTVGSTGSELADGSDGGTFNFIAIGVGAGS